MNTKYFTFLLISFCTVCVSCSKFLGAKPDAKLVTPSSIADLQALLDNNTVMNLRCAALGEISSDNYYLVQTKWQSLQPWDRHAYDWDTAIYSAFPNDWSELYDVVFVANTALENVGNLERNLQNAGAWDNVKGSALLFRAKSFLQSVWTWSKAYDPGTSGSDPGIPLRLTSDFNAPSVRASVKLCYEQIISDLKSAVPLLTANPVSAMRPSKAAAYGFLARTYLSMGIYDQAKLYTDSALQINSNLLDYNSLVVGAKFPFTILNNEVVMHFSLQTLHADLSIANAIVDTSLYNSYDPNDLRKSIFFATNTNKTKSFKGSYTGTAILFSGITVGEMYLTRAECEARSGDINGAANDLNTLLVKRWKKNMFSLFSFGDSKSAIDAILDARRKELVFRDLRWIDIKRVNKQSPSIVLQRIINAQNVVLMPNDNRFALPLPSDVVLLAGMAQNPR
jgi:tetratricopeptide (TPR) repeat protein